MEWTKIIAIGAAIGVVWFTFKQKRPAPVQIAVIIGLLGGGYYFFFMEDDKPDTGPEFHHGGCGVYGGGGGGY